MKNLLVLFTIAVFCFQKVESQTKVAVAIFPFVSALPEYKPRTSQIQQGVIEILRKKSNIELIDRSNDSMLVKELDLQIREQSMAANGLVQQGKILGAKQMIIGTLSNISVESKSSTDYNQLLKKTVTTTTYTAALSFSLQLSDVETGKVINQKVFTNNDGGNGGGKLLNLLGVTTGGVGGGSGSSREEAILEAIRASRKQISLWINESYPPEIKILKIEERDKKGNPETVLITGIDATLQKGSQVTVFEVEMIDAGGGKSLKRTKKIAELKIKEIQGDITICKVTDGEKVLEEKMNAGTKLEFTVK